jgi:FAD/FMN-containing dehydrogenase
VADGALMIDLSLMKAVRADPGTRTARAAGGVLLGELDRATQRFGLAVPSGIVSHTGIGGLTLGGGLGHTMRRFGLTVDNLRSVDLVTAEGEPLHVDAWTEPELFWGLRGGGGNFGIATAFEYRLHPVGPVLLGGPIFWSLADAPEVLRHLRDFGPQAPEELGMALFARLAPPGPLVPPEHFGKPVLGLTLAWVGDPAEGQRAVAPLRRVATPIADNLRPLPYLALQSLVDGGNQHGMHYYWRSQRVPVLTDDVVDVLCGLTDTITSPLSYTAGFVMGGTASKVDPDATAVGERGDGFELSILAAWPPPDADRERHLAWVRAGADALRPYRTGVYSHFLSDEGAAGVEAAYGDRLKRLTALKDRWDPDNLFHMNANIPPSA